VADAWEMKLDPDAAVISLKMRPEEWLTDFRSIATS
jgi:hypothetical protein